jgi:hypothetical protein
MRRGMFFDENRRNQGFDDFGSFVGKERGRN